MIASGRMKARITNVWAKFGMDPMCRRGWSRVVIESDLPYEIKVDRSGSRVIVSIPEAYLSMAEDRIAVYDGLITSIEVRRLSPSGARILVGLEHPAEFRVMQIEGIPVRNIIEFDRGIISEIFKHVVVGIDPGHGGQDSGARGPVNLLEKNVVWDIAKFLRARALEAGAKAVLTRDGDQCVTQAQRVNRVKAGRADLLVSIHTYWSRDVKLSGPRVLYYPAIPGSRELGKAIWDSLTEKLRVTGRGLVESPARPPSGLDVPSAVVEAVAISNWVDEGALRSPVFKEKVAIGILNGIKRFICETGGRGLSAGSGLVEGGWSKSHAPFRRKGSGFFAIPIRTHLVTEEDDIVGVVRRYTEGVAKPGDVVAVAESVVAITQGRAILPETVKPGILARFLCRFPAKDGSLATPPAMQLAISEVGPARVMFGAAAAGLGRLIGRRGDFFRVAGRSLALIDDIAGTMPPYDKHVVLGPKDADQLASRIKEETCLDAAIVDVNDLGNVDILGLTGGIDPQELTLTLASNPFGNDDQQTPIVVLKRERGE